MAMSVTFRRLLPTLVLIAASGLSGCAVVTVAGAAAGAAISVTGAVVSTTVKVGGKVIEKTIDAVTPSSPAPAVPEAN
jgi:predicted small secreted protein